MRFKDKYCMVVIDTKSKSFDNPVDPDPPLRLVWEIVIIPITHKLTVRKDKVYSVLMKPSESIVHEKKLPSKIKKEEWDTASTLEDEEFQEKLKKHLNDKFWIGWNISRIDVQNIQKIFTKIEPPKPVGVFNVLNWARAINIKDTRNLPDLRLAAVGHYLEIERKQKNRAEDDALLCVEVFRELLEDQDLSLEEAYSIMQSRRT